MEAWMLVVTRNEGKSLAVGDNIAITVVEAILGSVPIVSEAPPALRVQHEQKVTHAVSLQT